MPFLPVSKKSRILEIGCGVGHNLYALRELGYTNIYGTDYSSECIEVCAQRGFEGLLVDDESEKKFYQSKKKQYDCIILYDLVEHLVPADAAKLLESVRSMLRPHGSVIISLPNADHPFSNTLLFADITHKFIYNANSLSQLLRLSGFPNISFLQMNSWSLYDDRFLMRILKYTVLRLIGFLGELFWRGAALSQGIVLTQCKPTLVARASYA
jgi:SAM-dependent methyltransferase